MVLLLSRSRFAGDSTADVHVHMCMCNNMKFGPSFGAALTGTPATTLTHPHPSSGLTPHHVEQLIAHLQMPHETSSLLSRPLVQWRWPRACWAAR